jgi:ABC-2 type transport system permease protein
MRSLSRIFLVFKNEWVSVVWRRSFFLTLILLPLISFLLTVLITSLQPDQPPNPITQFFQSSVTPRVSIGYVDPSGLIKALPDWIDAGSLKRFPSEAQAEKALASQEIGAYYLIPPDYVKTGSLTVVQPNASPLAGASESHIVQEALNYNLLNQNAQMLRRLDQPLNSQAHYLNLQPQRDPENLLTFLLPYAVTLLFYIVILGSSSLMLNSIANEKQNQVMEILVTSVTPTQLLAGKMLALGLVGLLQTAVWSGSGFALLRLSGRSFNLPAVFQLSPSILLWGALFFLLGYSLYAGLMAGIGALVPGMREASQVTTVVVLPLVIPLALITILVRQPDSLLSVLLTLFPLTAPVMVMLRLSIGPVPIWQMLLAAALILISSLLLIRFVSGLFRARNLLSGQTFHWKTFVKALFGKA